MAAWVEHETHSTQNHKWWLWKRCWVWYVILSPLIWGHDSLAWWSYYMISDTTFLTIIQWGQTSIIIISMNKNIYKIDQKSSQIMMTMMENLAAGVHYNHLYWIIRDQREEGEEDVVLWIISSQSGSMIGQSIDIRAFFIFMVVVALNWYMWSFLGGLEALLKHHWFDSIVLYHCSSFVF